MLKGFVLGIIFTVVVAAGIFYAVIANGLIPASARTGEIWGEHWVAHTDLKAVLANDAPKGPNPVALNDANLIAGVQLYGQRDDRKCGDHSFADNDQYKHLVEHVVHRPEEKGGEENYVHHF